jgi:hypothetical protein
MKGNTRWYSRWKPNWNTCWFSPFFLIPAQHCLDPSPNVTCFPSLLQSHGQGMRCYGVQNYLKILKMDFLIFVAQLLWEVSTIAGWLAARLYRVVEVEGGLLICLWFKGPLRIFLKESIAAILKPMLAATKCMSFRFYWIACGYWRSSWFWQPGQSGRRREASTLLCLTWWCNIYTIKNMDVFLSEAFALTYI